MNRLRRSVLNHNWWIYEQIKEELAWQTNLSVCHIEQLTNCILARLSAQRLAIVPKYLSDDMYDAQKIVNLDINYPTANKLWTAAVDTFTNKNQPPPTEPDPQGGFW